MHNTRLGCLTPSGLIAAGLTILIAATFAVVRGGAMFSPGKLNAQPGSPLGGYSSHAEFANQCSLCHAPFWDAAGMSGRCETCHTAISEQRLDSTTLHGAIFELSPASVCQSCHPDHRGPSAPLTAFDNGLFPHEFLGYSLVGHAAHSDGSPFVCSDCHGADLTTFDPAICQTCHNQLDVTFTTAHVLSFGNDCLACHDGLDTYGDDFVHNIFPFPLTGKHVGAPCSACHLDAHTISDLRAAPVDCASCHADDDAHQGSLGSDCAACHNTNGWTPAFFDHNLSIFKLEGEHAEADCESCHINGVYKGTPTDCYSCHAEDDEHQGRFGTLCGNCHNPAGWLPATFDHNLSAFKLEGKHASVACESCHINNVYLGTPTDCYSCHAADDAHNGQYGTSCASCHTPAGWTPAFFDHNFSGFPLTGAHAGLACSQCHGGGVFSGLSTACAACHADPPFHAGLFTGTSCSQCHSTSSWTPASYNLSHPGGCDGNCINHEGASCRDCHTSNLNTATCTKCHDSNNPGDGGDD
ncbi:MAG: hypothetical protein HY781_01645 [Chloroflexi bacterium]|nr:hypothetical protein [Chloroflexota bacterium]